MADLKPYRAKRDPAATPEPFGEGRKGGKEPIFVVQRHAARSLHFDFRLERGGVLASWAVPKGVPLEPGARALAVHVEDHPLDYASFAGEIPAGQYGAGTVEIWDEGTYETLEEKRDGQLTVRLHGRRLQGTWTLVPTRLDGKERNWLLIRRSDDRAAAPAADDSRPMLATAAAGLPVGGNWLYEVKWDGFRALARVEAGTCRLVSRNGLDLTARFALVADALPRAVRGDAVLDGEICALDARGRSRFSLLQQGAGQLVFYVFDLLAAGPERLVGEPLTKRRARLEALLVASDRVRLSETFTDGPALLAAAREQGLEGIVAKRAESRYQPGRRSKDWLKLKTHGGQEFVVAGYTRGRGRRSGSLGALVLAVHEAGDLRYVGNVGTGFDDRELERLSKLLQPLERPTTPLPTAPKLPRVAAGDVVWVDPVLVVQVEFGEWTHDGHLRHPVYRGVRDDKAAAEVTRERPARAEPRRTARALAFSNVDKVFWPDEGITKGDLLAYYEAVAPVLVPHLRGRPFTMRRHPDGITGKTFFQKDAPAHMPDWIPTFEAVASTRASPRVAKTVRYPVVNETAALLWMANMACIDMNAWYSRVDRPERPDFVLFDLDPTPETPWRDTVEVARLVGELLRGLGLAAFVKTSGGKGLHIQVPIARRSSYADTRAFAEHVANAIVQTAPKLATREWVKAKRRGVLIDANQNGHGKTIASAYSVRPRPGAPVSTPLAWDEVRPDLDPLAFTMTAVRERVDSLGDLHAELLTTRQSLSATLRAALGA